MPTRTDVPEAVPHYNSDDDNEFTEPLVASTNRLQTILCIRRKIGRRVPKAAVSDYNSDDNYDGNEFPEQLVETTNRIEFRVQTRDQAKVKPGVKVKVEPG
jgi:hypothetical protein